MSEEKPPTRKPDVHEILTQQQWSEALIHWMQLKGRCLPGNTWLAMRIELNTMDHSMTVKLWAEEDQ